MSSGETENLKLPQYKGSDHPDFLDEINKAYKKIDDEIAALKTQSGSDSSSIEQIQAQIKTLSASVTQLQADVQELKGV